MALERQQQLRTFRKLSLLASLLATALALPLGLGRRADPKLKGAFRRPQQNGWTFVHLEGSPSEIGFQHGYLLAPEIREGQQVIALQLAHEEKKDWQFFRKAAEQVFWPKVEQEYREELQGIADGLRARGVNMDVWDVVAVNAWVEWSYYLRDLARQKEGPSIALRGPAERCSAFVATGSHTKDGRFVIAHNNWTGYLDGQRWTMIFDIVPSQGYRILMDGFPGFIHSGDDFGVNAAGLAITETTISGFFGWDSNGVPEFVRARKAMQYSASIDDFVRIMKESNNGGYANNWLVADTKTNEIASLELGLKYVTLERKRDGYFVSSNFPINAELAREETHFNRDDMGQSANARHARWDQLMEEHKGKVDVTAAQGFLSDHYDTYAKTTSPSERTLCGHIDLSPRGAQGWQPPYGTAGAVQNKVADYAMVQRMCFTAAAGHACGVNFRAVEHVRQHPEFGWQRKYLRDMHSHPWTMFECAR